MPAKRNKKTSALEVLQRRLKLMEKHNIKFEGPVPPNFWPESQRHIFSIISEIGAIRYNDYIQETRHGDIDKRDFRLNCQRVNELRTSAYKIRKEYVSTESTWRSSIEQHVLKRFSSSAVCTSCRNELWKSEYQAEPWGVEEKHELRRKREQRMRCQCNDEANVVVREPNVNDEERGDIFLFVNEGPVSQDLEATKNDEGVAKRPDSIIGLTLHDMDKQYVDSIHCELNPFPVDGSKVLYPFMLFEAKRDELSQGFRYMEAQAAFHLYRFLKGQEDIYRYGQHAFEPLVWFFASQGEIWRLSAGVMQGKKVRFFDLWLGTIGSYDGALQLLQIFDFIWTWARDIYRPSIRKCLGGDKKILRSISSPTNTKFDRAQSLLQDRQHHVNSETDCPGDHLTIDQPNATVGMGHSHPIFGWLRDQDIPEAWASRTIIRHSNVASCSFRVLNLPYTEESFEDLLRSFEGEPRNQILSYLCLLTCSPQYSIPLTRMSLLAIENQWLGTSTVASIPSWNDSTRVMRAFFFFQSFIQHHDWEIKRELCCIVWSWEASLVLGQLTGSGGQPDSRQFSCSDEKLSATRRAVVRETLRVRNLAEIKSVEYALYERSLVLSQENQAAIQGSEQFSLLHWIFTPAGTHLGTAVARLRGLFQATLFDQGPWEKHYIQSEKLLWIRPLPNNAAETSSLPLVSTRLPKTDAMVVVRPDIWPENSPKYCLFVLKDREIDKTQLGELLSRAIHLEMWARFATTNHADRELLREWLKALGGRR